MSAPEDEKTKAEMPEDGQDEALNDLTIEQIFAKLEDTLKKLESPDTPLEESFAEYEEGMKLVRACTEKIDKVEKQIIVLQGGDEGHGEQ